MKKIFVWGFMLIIIAIVAITKFVFPACQNEIIKKSTSNNGKYTAILYTRSCGATTSDFTNITIQQNNLPLNKKNIYRAEGYVNDITLNWENSNLKVGYPENLEAIKLIDRWKDITINYKSL